MGGHFVAPDGEMSPEIDVMLVDPQYPYLSQNENGSVVAMMHSVLSTIEVKLNLKGKEIKKIRKDTSTIQRFSNKVFPGGSWSKIFQYGIAYKTGFRLETVEKNFFVGYEENPPYTDLYILRLRKMCPKKNSTLGLRCG